MQSEGVAGGDEMLDKSLPERLRRSCRQRKIPLKLRQVSREASAWTAEAKHAPGTSTGRPEGWHEWLNKVTTFFKPSSSGDPLNPTDVHTLSFYEDLIDRLDREQEKADGDAQKPILRVRCECIECQFGFPSFQCKYQRCHLCK